MCILCEYCTKQVVSVTTPSQELILPCSDSQHIASTSQHYCYYFQHTPAAFNAMKLDLLMSFYRVIHRLASSPSGLSCGFLTPVKSIPTTLPRNKIVDCRINSLTALSTLRLVPMLLFNWNYPKQLIAQFQSIRNLQQLSCGTLLLLLQLMPCSCPLSSNGLVIHQSSNCFLRWLIPNGLLLLVELLQVECDHSCDLNVGSQNRCLSPLWWT